MKKILCIMLAGILSVVALTGCSSSELSYLSALTEVSAWETTNTKGSFTMDVNEDVLRQISSDYELGAVDIPFSKVKVDYDLTYATKTNDYSIDFDLTVDDLKVSAEVAIYNDSVYISKDTIKGAKTLLDKYSNGVNDATEMCNFMLDKMGDAKWFVYKMPAEATSVTVADSTKLVELMNSFLTSAYKDYDTGLFSGELRKGITFTMNPKNMENFVVSFMKYTMEHRDEIVEAGDKLLADIMELCPELKETVEEEQKHTAVCGFDDTTYCEPFSFESFVPKKDKLEKDYNDLLAELKDPEYLKAVVDFKDSYLTEKISLPSSGELRRVSDCAINYKGKKAFGYKADQLTTVMNNYDGVDGATYICDVDAFEKDYNKYINEKFPVKHVEIKWTSSDYARSADIEFERNSPTSSNRVSFSCDYTHVALVNEEGRIYVPMRKLAEGMGYEVEWDAEESKAYVIADDKKVDMSGLIVNDTTFIKVRDFEKLGLIIDYNEHHNGEFNYSEYVATIDWVTVQ